MLNPRKRKILQAIVDEYINTAEPVSSGSIVQKYGLDFSSATIRNEMADLEKSGYIEKTHTSSGRIPSALGYRLYVNESVSYTHLDVYKRQIMKYYYAYKQERKCLMKTE